jgi:ribosomal protein S18 acetylase RimI-like enzyme
MLGNERNRFSYKDWIFQPRTHQSYLFDCEEPEINKFFNDESFFYEELLTCKTYELTTDDLIAENLPPLAFISYANDAAIIEKNIKKFVPLPEGKHLKAYPAVKIAYLGVSHLSHRRGAGTDLLDITKILFTAEENRTGCRIINVDAHNSERALGLYQKAGFIYANHNDTPEKKPDKPKFRMFFDLMGPWDYDPSLLRPLK